jgi:hypothetical protein
MRSIECAGTISAQGELQLDELLPLNQPSRVRIIVLFPESLESDDITPDQWNKAVASNPSFTFLRDAEEDIYTLGNGAIEYQEGHVNQNISVKSPES